LATRYRNAFEDDSTDVKFGKRHKRLKIVGFRLMLPVFYPEEANQSPLKLFRALFACLTFTSELVCHAR
jgi:hypothetical protein